MLKIIYAVEKAPMDMFCPNGSQEYLETQETLPEIMIERNALVVPEQLLQLDTAQNYVTAVEVELWFYYAVRFGARLQ